MEAILSVNQLVKTFKQEAVENTVLSGISFNVYPGEWVAIMGQSGSGKSTLLYTISGMDAMNEGSVTIDGVDLASQNDDQLANLRVTKMGFIFQNNYLLKQLTLYDNICLPGLKANLCSTHEVKAYAEDLMRRLEIESVRDHGIHKVSGGQLQRAAICRALINRPKILFADEPTGALNSKSSQEVLSILSQLNQEDMTIFTVTHDPKVAAAAERIIYLKDGVIEAELVLGKLVENDQLGPREEKTMQWLLSMGF